MMQRLITPRSFSFERAAQLLSAEEKNADRISFSGIVSQDIDVEPGDLFVALPGQNVHGSQFIEKARSRGAVA